MFPSTNDFQIDWLSQFVGYLPISWKFQIEHPNQPHVSWRWIIEYIYIIYIYIYNIYIYNIYIYIFVYMVHIIFHSIPFHFSSQEIGNFDFRSCSPLSTCFARSADQSDVVGDSGWAWMNLRSCGSDFEQVTKSQQSIWFFPECVARVPVSLRGSGGWGCVPSTLRLCSQPFATVRASPVWPCLW